MGVASPATSSTIIMSSTWASVVPDGTVPKDYPRHFDGLSARPGAPVSRRSPRSRAHRGHRAWDWSRRGTSSQRRTRLSGGSTRASVGQRRPRAGHSRRLWERLWERRLELGANTYRVLVHPTSTTNPILGVLGRCSRRFASGSGVLLCLVHIKRDQLQRTANHRLTDQM